MVQSVIQNSVRRILKTRAALHQPSCYLLTGAMHFCRHARPGQAPLPCPVYPLSAASVGAWAILYMRVCHASASIKLILLAGEMQQPPVNHPFCCCSIVLIFYLFIYFSFDSLQKPMFHLVKLCSWFFRLLQREMVFRGSNFSMQAPISLL